MKWFEYQRLEKDLGARCIECMHNGMKGLKAKALKRVFPNFQAFDMFEECEAYLQDFPEANK